MLFQAYFFIFDRYDEDHTRLVVGNNHGSRDHKQTLSGRIKEDL